MKRWLLLVVLLLEGCGAGRERAPRASVASAYLDAAIDSVRAHALFRDSVDWPAARREAHGRLLEPDTTPVAAYAAIRFVLNALGDNHSFLQLSDSLAARERRLEGPAGSEASGTLRSPSAFGTRMQPEAEVVERGGQRIGFVFMPQGRRNDAFATRFAGMVDSVERKGVCGWVVDLRGNGGGNMWPMLAGLGALIGEGNAGGWVDVDGKAESFLYRHGQAVERDTAGAETVRATAARPPAPIRPTTPVAVLIDRGTGSSGEAMAVAFKARAHTRFFGEPTYGATTATHGFSLADGANLVLAVAMMRDAHGRMYPHGVRPDEQVPSPTDTIPNAAHDTGRERAVAWLMQRPSCR